MDITGRGNQDKVPQGEGDNGAADAKSERTP